MANFTKNDDIILTLLPRIVKIMHFRSLFCFPGNEFLYFFRIRAVIEEILLRDFESIEAFKSRFGSNSDSLIREEIAQFLFIDTLACISDLDGYRLSTLIEQQNQLFESKILIK